MTENNPSKLPPPMVLMRMFHGALIQRSICVVAKLGIADLLAEKPQTTAELAARTKTHAPSLYRLLRALVSEGIFTENAEQKFELTPISEWLRSDAPNSFHDYAVMLGEDWVWSAYKELMYSVQTGGVALEKVQGMRPFAFFEQNSEAGNIFNRAMTGLSLSVIPAIVAAYSFLGMSKLVDIAGGHGQLLSGVLKANPHLLGVLFDLPFVIAGAEELLKKEGVSDRIELASGDFFESVPAGADAYMMKQIIHDWDDEQSVKILQNIRSAMNENAKVLIVEMVVPEGNMPSSSKTTDLQMLVIQGGKERTEEEYRKLLEASGFRLTRVIPTNSPLSIIEGERIF